MSVSNNIVSAPVSISEVSGLIGAGTNDLGTLCKHPNINKWAVYKPLRIAGVNPITLEQRKGAKMGLAPISIPALKDSGTGIVKKTISEVESGIREWDYDKPAGGSTSPYRLSDFIDAEHPESLGYNHQAVACDSDWGDVDMRKPDSASGFGILVANFSFRLNEETASNIGGANYDFMPLSYIVPNVNNWYLGLALYIPGQNIDGWMFIRGEKSLSEVTTTTISQVFPTVATNQWLRDLLINMPEVTYVPCILVNPITRKIQEQAQRTYVCMDQGTVYCMPSGAKHHKVYLNVAIQNSSKQIVFNGSTVWANYLSATYYVAFPRENVQLMYLIKGYVDNATGKTKGGWFIASVQIQSAAYGFSVRQLIVIYATTVSGSNILEYSAAPPESLSVSEYLYCKKLVDLGINANTRYEWYGYQLTSGTISNTSKVTLTRASDYGGNVSFYGYIPTDSPAAQVGLTVDGVR